LLDQALRAPGDAEALGLIAELLLRAPDTLTGDVVTAARIASLLDEETVPIDTPQDLQELTQALVSWGRVGSATLARISAGAVTRLSFEAALPARSFPVHLKLPRIVYAYLAADHASPRHEQMRVLSARLSDGLRERLLAAGTAALSPLAAPAAEPVSAIGELLSG
jgi:hypothetical protein